jgi:hypothetical protein
VKNAGLLRNRERTGEVLGMFGFPMNVQVTAKTSLNHQPGNTEFGFGLELPLGNDRNNRTPLPKKISGTKRPASEDRTAAVPKRPEEAPDAGKIPYSALTGTSAALTGKSGINAGLALLLEKLIADGFQNIRVGTGGRRSWSSSMRTAGITTMNWMVSALSSA